MSCIFCQEPCIVLQSTHEQCSNHKYRVIFAIDKIDKLIRYYTIEGGKHMFSYYYKPDRSICCFLDTKLDGDSYTQILSLNYDPKVTPENFDTKIKTLLTFS